MKAIADFCYRRRRYVALGWVVLVVALFALSGAVGGEYRTEFKLPGSETQAAVDLLKDRGVEERSGFQGQIVFRAEQGVDDPAVRQTMERFFDDVAATLEGEQVVSPYDPANAHQVSPDRTIAYAEINLSDRGFEDAVVDGNAVRALWDQLDQGSFQVELGGDLFAEQPPFSSEVVGLIAAVIILLVAFGSLFAMALPVVTALFGIACGFAIIAILTRFLAVPEFTGATAAMIGIGVGIDYALIIVTRYRQGLHDGLDPHDATVLALNTSGRAVVFAGITVVISLLGIFLMNLDFMRAVALAAVSAVAMTMLAAITLLPALLGFVGRRIDRFGLPHRTSRAEGDPAASFWYRWSRMIQARPWPALVVSLAILLVLASPVFALRLGFGDAGNRLETDTTRRAYDLLSSAFGPGFNAPILIVVDTPEGIADQPAVASLGADIAATEGVASVIDPIMIPDAGLAILNVYPASSFQDKESTALVHRLRDDVIPPFEASSGLTVYATGGPPGIVDFSDYMAERLPWFIGAVLVLSFLLLLVVFHSIVVPIKAVIMNMLSIGAAFGATVAVFQWGIGADLIGIEEGPIDAWIPMMLFAIVFGLSMDYEVFLLTRIREEYDRSGDSQQAVADGLAATGRVISAAAAIMVCVFGSFVLGADRSLKLFGFGLAVAVFIDATIVRLVLVPAAMELMGNANWWAPRWLVRYLPTIRVDDVPRLEPAFATIEDPAAGS
jgi:RND superfamily putative drug exporter